MCYRSSHTSRSTGSLMLSRDTSNEHCLAVGTADPALGPGAFFWSPRRAQAQLENRIAPRIFYGFASCSREQRSTRIGPGIFLGSAECDQRTGPPHRSRNIFRVGARAAAVRNRPDSSKNIFRVRGTAFWDRASGVIAGFHAVYESSECGALLIESGREESRVLIDR